MAVDRAALHQFVTGSLDLGQYPSPLYGQVEKWRQGLLAECKARGITVHLTGSTAPQTHAPVSTLLSDCVAQFGERWPDPTRADGMAWSLQEAIEQIRLCCLELDAADQPAPAPPPAGTLPAGTAQGVLQWAADLSKPDVVAAGFKSTPWNTQSGPTWPPPIVAAPDGRRSVKFALAAGGKRIEIEPNCRTFPAGDDAWIGFSVLFDAGFPLTVNDWSLVAQLHGDDTTSPQQCLQVRQGQFHIADGHAFGPQLVTGRRYRVVVHASMDPRGTTSVWVDDQLVCDGYQAGLNATPLYLKTGWYRNPPIPGGVLYQADHKLGTGYGSVRPT